MSDFKVIDAAIVVLAVVLIACIGVVVLDLHQVSALESTSPRQITPTQTVQQPAPSPVASGPLVFIEGVPIVHQMPRWPTGCEIVALKMLAEYHGVDKAVDEWIKLLPRGPIYWKDGKMRGPDPREMFAGDPYSKRSYGVYHQPLLRILKTYFESRVANLTGRPWEDYEAVVASGSPVLVWGTISNAPVVLRNTWVTPFGEEFTWTGNAHTMLLVGFTETKVLLNDPYTGTLQRFDKAAFLKRWSEMGRQGIAITP